jgi:hypothetical protein
MFVSSKKFKQWLQTFFVAEHIRRKVTIEELNTIAYGSRPVGSRKCGIEWLKIKLERIWVGRRAIYELFLKAEIFRNSQLLDTELMDIDTYIFPNPWPRANGYSHEWRNHYSFLSRVENFAKGTIVKRVVVADYVVELIEQVMWLQNSFSLSCIPGEESNELVTMSRERVFHALPHAWYTP